MSYSGHFGSLILSIERMKSSSYGFKAPVSNFMHELVLKFRGGISLLVNCGEDELPQEKRTHLSIGHFENTNLPVSVKRVSDFALPHSVHSIYKFEMAHILHFHWSHNVSHGMNAITLLAYFLNCF